MNIVLDRMTRNFARRLEQWADIHVETDIREGRCDYFCAAVVAVLAHLGNQDARAPAFRLLKFRHHPFCLFELFGFAALSRVDTRNSPRGGLVAAPHIFKCGGDFAECRTLASGIHGALQKVAVAAGGAVFELLERLAYGFTLAFALQLCKTVQLRFANS